MENSPTRSNPVNKNNVDYTQTVQSIREFLTLITDYYPSISELISSAETAFVSFKIAVMYTLREEWQFGTESSGVGKEGKGKQATEEFIQTLVKISRKFYDVQQNLCARAVILREHLKARLPNLVEAKIKMLNDNLEFTRPTMEIISSWHAKQFLQCCYHRNIDQIERWTDCLISDMTELNTENVAKLYFLEKCLAEILYSLPSKEGTNVDVEKS